VANKFNPDWDELAACKECLQEYMEEIKKLKKEWVGLTAADLMELVAFTHMTMENALSVEAKLKEKNT